MHARTHTTHAASCNSDAAPTCAYTCSQITALCESHQADSRGIKALPILALGTFCMPCTTPPRVRAYAARSTAPPPQTFGTDPDQPNALACNELQSPVDVCNLVDPHLALGLSRGDLVSGDHLQQFQQLKAIAKVDVDVFDQIVLSGLPQV